MDETAKKHALISATILALVNNGCDISLALDLVLGKGTYDRLVTEVYTELNKKERIAK